MEYGLITVWTLSELQPHLSQSGRVNCACSWRDRVALVGTEGGGLFRSTDGAATFTHVDSVTAPWVNDVLFLTETVAAATTGALAQMGSFGGIWISHDSGLGWSQLPDTPGTWPDLQEAYQIACPYGSGIACIGTNRGLLISSTLFAASFLAPIPVPNGGDPAIRSVAILSTTASHLTIVAAGPSGLYRSADGGSTWSSLSVPGMAAITSTHGLDGDSALAVAIDDAGKVFASQDAGRTWSLLDPVPSVPADRSPGGNLFVRVRYGNVNAVEVYTSNRLHLFRRTVSRPDGLRPFDLSGGWSELSADHDDVRCIALNGAYEPYLLGTDGGLHRTPDGGGSWPYTAGNGAGLSALQIYDVNGQLILDRGRHDLYIGTQDNNLWASSDVGLTWPANQRAEGYFIECLRRVPNEGASKITYQVGSPMHRTISGPLFAWPGGWSTPPSTPPTTSSPFCFGSPGSYVQFAEAGTYGPGVCRTGDYGGRWDTIARFNERPYGPLHVVDNEYRTTVYQPIDSGDLDGVKQLKLVKVVYDKRLSVGYRTYPRMALGGSAAPVALGIQTTMFKWAAAIAVDPFDDLHLIAADINNETVVRSVDGGDTWQEIPGLTAQLRETYFRFRGDGKFEPKFVSLVQVISFYPDDPTFVLLATNGAGVWSSSDRGDTWNQAAGRWIPKISSIYWLHWDHVIFASYGRGLWRMRGRMRVVREARDNVLGANTMSVQIDGGLTGLGFDISHLVYGGRITGLDARSGNIACIYVSPGSSYLTVCDKDIETPVIAESAQDRGFLGVKQQPEPPAKGWIAAGLELSAQGELSVIYAADQLQLTRRREQPISPAKDQPSPYAAIPSVVPALYTPAGKPPQYVEVFQPGDHAMLVCRNFDPQSKSIQITLDGVPTPEAPVWVDKQTFTVNLKLPLSIGVYKAEIIQRGIQNGKPAMMRDTAFLRVVPADLKD